jgi:hypothetical protein
MLLGRQGQPRWSHTLLLEIPACCWHHAAPAAANRTRNTA